MSDEGGGAASGGGGGGAETDTFKDPSRPYGIPAELLGKPVENLTTTELARRKTRTAVLDELGGNEDLLDNLVDWLESRQEMAAERGKMAAVKAAERRGEKRGEKRGAEYGAALEATKTKTSSETTKVARMEPVESKSMFTERREDLPTPLWSPTDPEPEADIRSAWEQVREAVGEEARRKLGSARLPSRGDSEVDKCQPLVAAALRVLVKGTGLTVCPELQEAWVTGARIEGDKSNRKPDFTIRHWRQGKRLGDLLSSLFTVEVKRPGKSTLRTGVTQAQDYNIRRWTSVRAHLGPRSEVPFAAYGAYTDVFRICFVRCLGLERGQRAPPGTGESEIGTMPFLETLFEEDSVPTDGFAYLYRILRCDAHRLGVFPPVLRRRLVVGDQPWALHRMLGHGASGIVYLASKGDPGADDTRDAPVDDPSPEGAFAVKLLWRERTEEQEGMRRLAKERETLQHLNPEGMHRFLPHVAAHADFEDALFLQPVGTPVRVVFDSLLAGGGAGDGEDWGTRLRAGADVEQGRTRLARLVVEGVRAALAHAHGSPPDGRSRGYVHLDVRPSNIVLVAPEGVEMQAVLVDWGLAQTFRDGKVGACGCTPYMPSEMLELDEADKGPWLDMESLAYTFVVLTLSADGEPVWARSMRSDTLVARRDFLTRAVGEDFDTFVPADADGLDPYTAPLPENNQEAAKLLLWAARKLRGT